MKTIPLKTQEAKLYYRAGSSDKVYNIWIENVGANHTVRFEYGRRGSSLTSGVKFGPGHHAAAIGVYNKLVLEKISKGYKLMPPEPKVKEVVASPGPFKVGGKTKTAPEPEPPPPTTTEIGVQLLNSIDEDAVDHYLSNDKFVVQEKFDGRRITIAKRPNSITQWNRKGLAIPVQEEYAKALNESFGDYCFTLDGEACGPVLWVFDILELENTDLRARPYEDRLTHLGMLMRSCKQNVIREVTTAFSTSAKTSLFDSIRKSGKEGIVIKDKTAPYTIGRPNSGGPQLKYKIVQSVSCSVLKVNDKRSVEVGLIDRMSTALVSVGNVSVPVSYDLPATGQIVEVRYLYAYAGGSLYQPVYLGVRDDVEVDELERLKFKAEEDHCHGV